MQSTNCSCLVKRFTRSNITRRPGFHKLKLELEKTGQVTLRLAKIPPKVTCNFLLQHLGLVAIRQVHTAQQTVPIYNL